MSPGRNSAIWGNTINMPRKNIIKIMKGTVPLKISTIGTDLSNEEIMKTTVPTGGLISPHLT